MTTREHEQTLNVWLEVIGCGNLRIADCIRRGVPSPVYVHVLRRSMATDR